MLLLLPPSETKRDGGADDAPLDLARLSHQGLTSTRRAVLASLRSLSRNLSTMSAALKLGPTQQFELLRNRAVRTSATMPALDRYTGVLFDALSAGSLPGESREFAAGRVVIHSALFGLLDATDPIPAYRVSHDSRLPGLPLRGTWSGPISAELGRHDGLIIDLRSESYVHLGPVPVSRNSFSLRVVAEGADGRVRALNHFNKKGKGEFLRELLLARRDHDSVDSLLSWAAESGWRLSTSGTRELELVVR
jgi:cytoplasmic iron level regulating protein YaaA (DUF328/UPF0246 family)